MKNKYIFFAVLALFFSACYDEYADKNPDFLLETVFIDNDERLLYYNAVTNTQREPCFIEEFDDNSSQFPLRIGTYTKLQASIVDSKMIIKYLVDKNYIYSWAIPVEMDKNRNFEMEISLGISRSDSVPHDFALLHNQTASNYYIMEYNCEYEYDSKNEIIKTIEKINLWKKIDEWEALKGYDYNAKDFLDSNEFTVLTIRKIGNKYAIFINHKLFYIINDKNFSYIPEITVDGRVVNVFDYFRVYYLP